MSRLGDRYRFNPNAPLNLTLPPRPREYDGSGALPANRPEITRPVSIEAEAEAPARRDEG